MSKPSRHLRRSLRRRPLALAVASLLLAGTPALAQQTGREAAQELDTMIVTATRRDETVQDVPLNITAVGRAEIEQRGLQDLADLVRSVPGLYLVDQGGRDANLLTVRGLNVNSLGASEGVGNSGGGVVAQYIGDIPLFLDLRLMDIERVETLLGPQGTLYGAGTLGGAIRYIPAKPEFGETSAEFQGGVYGMSQSESLGVEGTFIGNLPIGETGAFRAALGYFDDPGFIDYNFLVREPGVSNPEPPLDQRDANLTRKRDANDQQTLAGRFGLRFGFGDSTEATLTYTYQRQEAGARTVNHRESFGTGRYESAYRFLEPNDRETQLLSLEVTADLGFATLTSATGVSRFDEEGQRDQTDLLLDFEYGYEDFPSFAAFTRETNKEDGLNQEFRLVSNAEGPFRWILGAFYNESEVDATSSEFVPGIPQFFGINRPDNLEYFQATFVDFTEKALFGEIAYDFTDRWSATVGARRFSFKDRSRVGFALPLIDGSGPNEILPDFETVDVSDKDTIFKFNTAFKFSADMLGYFTLSEGYRTGGSNAVPACQTPLLPGQNVCALPNEVLILPDKTLNHEIGLRTSWNEGRLIINGSLYYITWDDIQVAGTTVNGNIPITVNGAEARSQGLELNFYAKLAEQWRLSGAYTYNNAELTKDAPGIVNGEDAFSGDRLPGSPKHQASLALNYSTALANGWRLSTDWGVSVQDSVLSRVGLRNGGEELGGYSLHNAAVTLGGGNWALRFYAKNVFDKYAETGVRNNRDFTRDIGGDADGDGVIDHTFRTRNYYKSVLEPLRVGVNYTYYF